MPKQPLPTLDSDRSTLLSAYITLVNIYDDLVVFKRIAGTS